MSSCALREVLEETGYDATANLLLDDYIDFTNRKQAVRLYLCPDVPMNTRFETRTRKEIRKISWIKIEQLPMSFEANKQPGMKYYSVSPVVVSQLRSWVKRRNRKKNQKSGKKGKKNNNNNNNNKNQRGGGGADDPNFPTDSQISAKDFTERDLVPWEASEEDSGGAEGPLLNLSAEKNSGSWNQGEANHKKVGFVSDYNPEDYTTKLAESNSAYADELLKAYGLNNRKKNYNQGIPSNVIAKGGKKKSSPSMQIAKNAKMALDDDSIVEASVGASVVKSKAMEAFDDL
jgi:hypothetical protein